jgi:hypothetical protein
VEEYPANTHKVTQVSAVPAKDETTPEKVVEKVTLSPVVQRKRPLSKRFTETFFGSDAKGVLGYVLTDVIIPAVKDTVADAFSQGIERMLFGESRSTSRRTGARPSGTAGYVSYNRFGSSPPQGRREEPRTISRRARSSHDFGELIRATRAEAEEVINRLFDLVEKYEHASVADLYDLVGITGNYTDSKWGWKDLRGATPHRVRDGYLLELPRTEPLD